jgi:hypothetical protein
MFADWVGLLAATLLVLVEARSQYPSPDRPRLGNTKNYDLVFINVSGIYGLRTKRRRQLALERMCRRESQFRLGGSEASQQMLQEKPAVIGCSEAPVGAGETVLSGSDGGEGGRRNH